VNDVVAAWTATIDACGKSGRVETGLSLFESMKGSEFIVPNGVTCSCMFDLLVRNNDLRKALGILKYMKVRGLVPTEFMYTTILMAANRGVYSDDIFVELISLLSKGEKRGGSWDGDAYDKYIPAVL